MIYKNKLLDISSIKNMDYMELDDVCKEIRKEIIRVVSLNGGHLSSNLGVVELTLALVRAFDFPHDKLLFDVGHQSYTYKLLTNRNLDTLRKKNGVSGFQKIDESIYDIFEAGHSSTSLSVSLGLAISRDFNKEDYHVISVIGDASILNGMALEALNDIGYRNHKVIIILNDNDMAISQTMGAIHKLKDKKEFFKQFDLDYIGIIDGHNIKELENSLNLAKKNQKSIVVHIKTIKGKGYKYAEIDKIGKYHLALPFNIETGEFKKENELISYPSFFSSLIDKAMEKDEKIVLLCPSTSFGSSLYKLFEKYKNRCFDVGIAEEHCLTLAAGFALNGYKVIISIYATFLQRALDQVEHDLARMNLPILLLVDRSGLIGEDGETHQGIYDQAFLLNVPNITLCVPSDMKSSISLFKMGLNNKKGPFIIKYPKTNYLINDNIENIDLEYGKWRKEMESNIPICFISYGPLISKLKQRLKEENININLYNALFLKPIEENSLQEIMKNDYIFIVDTMSNAYGFINMISAYLLKHHYKGEIKTRAIKDDFIKQGTIDEQLKEQNLDVESILGEIKYIYSRFKEKSSKS